MAEPHPLLSALPRVKEEALGPADLEARLTGADAPFVVRGLAADWPLAAAARSGDEAVRQLLADHARNRAFPVHRVAPGAGERLFYTDDGAMNFTLDSAPLPAILAAMAKTGDDALYCSSLDIDDYFTGLADTHRAPLGARRPLTSLWIGTRTRIAAHNDVPDNLAVVLAGRRRFTLFPPDAFRDLYPGPLDHTPAGRPISMVDFADPDLAAHPRFAAALERAVVAELDPGDALFIPSLWWHHVEGLAGFNLLLNFWWRDVPAFLGKPEDALYHAILAIRDLPPADRRRWRDQFDHYVFDNGADVTDHLPPAQRGILAPLDARSAGSLRARLLRSLSR